MDLRDLILFYFFISWLAFILFLNTILIAKRKTLFFKFRGPFLILIYNLCALATFLSYFLFDDLIDFIVPGFFIGLDFGIILLRNTSILAQQLHSHFHVYKEFELELHSLKLKLKRDYFEQNAWILEYRIYYVLSIVIPFVATIFYVFLNRQGHEYIFTCDGLFECTWTINCFFVIIVVFNELFLRDFQDFYKINFESRNLFLVLLVHYLFVYIQPYMTLGRFTLICCHFILIAIRQVFLVAVPIFQYSLQNFEKIGKESVVPDSLEYQRIMTSYLRVRYCVQYYLFIVAVEHFKKEFSVITKATGKRLFKKFLNDQSLHYLDDIPFKIIAICDELLEAEMILNSFDDVVAYIENNILSQVSKSTINFNN
eukprot:NODE_52_length_30984_cov_1.383358.p13 type:complete len:370 gc:universal NODE_52_length_30984_cov_1.383358:4174-5283(+)